MAALAGATLLAACSSTDEPQPFDPAAFALNQAVGAAIDVLTVYDAQGDVPAQTEAVVSSLADYASAACPILVDGALSPADRSLMLAGLAPERAALDAAIADTVGVTDPLTIVLVRRALAVAREYAIQGVGPEVWGRPCAAATAFAEQWANRLPAA
jgi:hypothetical protein